MEIAEEDTQQVAKRAAIQSIMGDTSLTPQEKQRKIQEFMASGGKVQSAPAPTSAQVSGGDGPVPTSQVENTAPPQREEPMETPAPVNSRQAMMSNIMRDPNLTPQEKQKRIQEIMAGGSVDISVPTPATVAAPAETPPPANSRQALMSSIMRDSSLTPQEKQERIQEIMAGTASASTPAPEPTPLEPGPPATIPSTSKQAMMQEVMSDPDLTPVEKQRKIQQILKGGSVPPATETESKPANTPDSSNSRALVQEVMRDTSLTPQERQQKVREIMAATPASAPAARTPVAAARMPGDGVSRTSSSGVGAVASTGVDPASRKGGRASAPITSTAATAATSGGRAVSSTGEDPAARKAGRASVPMTPAAAALSAADLDSRSPPIGAVASTANDPAARKSARTSAMTTQVEATVDSVEPAAMPTPTLGAVSSSGVDPAYRKSSRNSTMSNLGASASVASRASDPAIRKTRNMASSNRNAASVQSRQMDNSIAQVGDSQSVVSSRSDDPAARKVSRNSTRHSSAAPAMATELQTSTSMQTESSNMAVAGQQGTGTPVRGPTSYTISPQTGVTPASDDMNSRRVPLPVLSENQPSHQQMLNPPRMSTASGPAPEPSPVPAPRETYAGLALAGTDIVGADTGGFEAFVAGEPDEEVVGATEVVTEAQIEEEDKRRQAQLLRKGLACMCLLLVAIVVVVVIVSGGGDDGPVEITDSPSSFPSSAPSSSLFADVLDAVRDLYPDEASFNVAFSSADTPQFRAANWVANVAPLDLAGDDPRMISRFALVTFYFATEGDDWTRCGFESTNCDEGREWLTAESECDWLAIGCADPEGGDYAVVELFFPPTVAEGNNVAGFLPLEVSFLPQLQRIILSNQAIGGSIPQEWSNLSQLTTFIIGGNELTGNFPVFLLENTLLGTLFLTDNKLNGTIPTLASLSLEELRIDGNMFSGPIPADVDGLNILKEFNAERNNFQGSVPEGLYNMPQLRVLSLSNNPQLEGELTESVSAWRDMRQLRLVNTTIGGALPSALFDLIDLSVLELSNAAFSGPLSEDFEKLGNITQIRLNDNAFSGTIPSAFATLERLRFLELDGNELTGTVSEELCARTGPSFLDISLLTTDCEGDPPKVLCSCCNNCPVE